MVRDNSQYIFYPETGKTKKTFFIFFTILAIVMLSSCKKAFLNYLARATLKQVFQINLRGPMYPVLKN
jgi:hypothetical protein